MNVIDCFGDLGQSGKCHRRKHLKNFPHQFNNLGKLTAALGIASHLIAAGQDYNDGAGRTFGRALAEAGIYQFRDKTRTIAQNLQAQSARPAQDRGFETAGRDIRNFFQLARLVNQSPELTQLGRDILAASANISLSNALWREAMLGLTVGAQDATSHPYRIMLRLLADRPGIETAKLMLALEAANDSPTEYVRILQLADLSVTEILVQTGTSPSSARNAVKILPAIAEQLGDLVRRDRQAILANNSAPTEDSLNDGGSSPEFETSQILDPTPVNPSNIAPIPNFGAPTPNVVDLAAAIEIRRRRTIEHQHTVVSIATVIAASGFQTYANPYDCLGHRVGDGSLLVEVKTLDGTRSDERRQSEKALGQIRGYRYFSLPPAMKQPRLIELVAYSAPPSTTAIGFLRDNNVECAWPVNNQWLAIDGSGNANAFSPDALFA
jgi:hypothetical protein